MPESRLRLPAARMLVAALLLWSAAAPREAISRALDLPVRDAAHPDAPLPAYAGDRLIVRLAPAAAAQALPLARSGAARAALGLRHLDALARGLSAALEPEFPGEPEASGPPSRLAACWRVRLAPGTDLAGALDAFAALPEVEEAWPVALCPVVAMPDDSLWSVSWWLDQPGTRHDIHCREAWQVSLGDTSVPIAILDTGVLRDHPDLGGTVAGGYGNLWTNAAELAGAPGVDDDGNGYVDDVWGWDFISLARAEFALSGEDWRDADNDPDDFAGHGTAVASLAGAMVGNGIGLAGPLWDVRLMALRVGWASPTNPAGEVDLSDAAQAIRYATRNGAKVVNCSFATLAQYDLLVAVEEAIAAGVLVVSAAGNNGTPNYLTHYPQVLSVGATDSDDKVTLFSNRDEYVDVVAPGQELWIAIPRRTGTDSLGMRTPAYVSGGAGTSFAAPLAAAGAALVIADRAARGLPPLTPQGLVLRLRESSDDISGLNVGSGYGEGRLDLGRALTDPLGSFTARAPGVATGAGVVLRSERGRSLLVTPVASGALAVADALTGRPLPAVPLPAAPAGSIAAAWLGPGRGDGLFVPLVDGRIAGYDERLRPLAGWPVGATRAGGTQRAQLALGDLDGDGVTDIVWGGIDGSVYAWDPHGARRAGFPRPVGGADGPIGIALGDLDGRPGLEIVAAHPSGSVVALRSDGTQLAGWPVQTAIGPAPPLIARFTAGGPPRVVVGAQQYLTAWDAAGVRQASRVMPNAVSTGPALGDLDGDGSQDLVVATGLHLDVMDSRFYPLTGSVTMEAAAPGEPLLGPLLSLGTLAIATVFQPSTGWPSVAVFDRTGVPLSFTKPGFPGLFPFLDDVDDDGRTELVTGVNADSELVAFDLGSGTWRPDRAVWPAPRGNAARTGAREGAPPLAPLDDAGPFPVTDLAATSVSAHGARLGWTAPADTGYDGVAARYRIRYTAGPLDAATFESADSVALPPPADTTGTPQHADLAGLRENTTYRAALIAYDHAGNPSALSVVATFTTGGDAPSTVRDLHVDSARDTALTLRWTAVGDDGAAGRPARYLVRAARRPLDDAGFDTAEREWSFDASADAGAVETHELGGFTSGERWWFALRAQDASGNLSALSNVATAVTGPLAARAGIAIGAGENPAHAPVPLYWQAPVDLPGVEQRIRVFDANGRLVRTLPVGREGAGLAPWDGRDEHGTRVAPGLYFARFESGAAHRVARFALLR